MSCLTIHHQPSHELTVGQLVVERPARARVFERLGIDYCCGGRKPLAQACREKDLDLDAVLRELDADAEAADLAEEPDWAAATLGELADHIEQTHHAFLKAELPRLDRLTRKVAAVHGQRHPELVALRLVYARLRRELESHLLDEEAVVFPLCRRLDAAGAGGAPDAAARSVRTPIAALTHEHDDAGAALAEMRRLAADYVPPEGACNTYRAMLTGLAELEADMHRHVHKENNILFPRAVDTEAGRRAIGEVEAER